MRCPLSGGEGTVPETGRPIPGTATCILVTFVVLRQPSMPGDPVKRTNAARTEEFLAQVNSSQACDALRRWANRNSAVLNDAKWSSEGFTEAQVLGAYIQGYRAHMNGVIIKITERGDPDKEIKAHRKAYGDSPAFAKRHLAQLDEDLLLGNGGSIMFQSVAGGGFLETQEIDKALPGLLDPVDVCSRITSSLLTEWNTGSESQPESIGIVLSDLLADRLSRRGTIGAWAARHDGLLTEPRMWLRHGGQPWVNPFALVGENPLAAQLGEILVTRGKVHGDLHPGNLLIPTREDDTPYFLVDLARYSESGLLAWDPIYLTLTTIAKSLSAVDPCTYDTLQRWVLDPDTPPDRNWPAPLRAIGLGVHQASVTWARQKSIWPAWSAQRMLCVIAVALVLTGRSRLLNAQARTWFFWLAVRAATRLVPFEPDFKKKEPLALPESLFPASFPADKVIHLNDHRSLGSKRPAEPAQSASVNGGPGLAEAETEPWSEFVAELRVIQLNAQDASSLAALTEILRTQLAHALSAVNADSSESPDGSVQLLNELAATLDEALQPGATSTDVRAACRHAMLLRTWILGLLP
jgi:hypothetical protein